jgi:hypothetical protein
LSCQHLEALDPVCHPEAGEARRPGESSKLQHPSTREIPNKEAPRAATLVGLVIGASSFSGCWSFEEARDDTRDLAKD